MMPARFILSHRQLADVGSIIQKLSISHSLVFRKEIGVLAVTGRPNANRRRIDFAAHPRHETAFKRGCSSMVEQQPSKLNGCFLIALPKTS
jgi:hypothetical protein